MSFNKPCAYNGSTSSRADLLADAYNRTILSCAKSPWNLHINIWSLAENNNIASSLNAPRFWYSRNLSSIFCRQVCSSSLVTTLWAKLYAIQHPIANIEYFIPFDL